MKIKLRIRIGRAVDEDTPSPAMDAGAEAAHQRAGKPLTPIRRTGRDGADHSGALTLADGHYRGGEDAVLL